jgi:hypothetical protein
VTERDPSADWILGLRGVRRRVDEGEGGPCECEPSASLVRPPSNSLGAAIRESARRLGNEVGPLPCFHSWRHLRTEIRSREFTDYKVDVFHCGHCLEYREVEWPR